MIILIPTHYKNEKYCNLLLDMLDVNWPNHPELWFLTDGENINYPNVIKVDNKNWLIVLYKGLKFLINKYPDLDYIYLVLEDLIPLWSLSVQELTKIENVVINNKLKNVSFITYPAYWGQENEVKLDGITLYKIPEGFDFYSQLQPAIWEVDHLMKICEYALENNLLDAWSFEWIKSEEQHYVSSYQWPTVFNGFLVRGRVNLPAINKIKSPEGKKLKNQLLKSFIFDLPSLIKYRINRKFNSILSKKLFQ